MVISIGNGVLKSNDPKTLSEFGGQITLTEDWTRSTLQSVDCIKWKETIRSIEPLSQLLVEERFVFQNSITAIVNDHDIPSDLIINLDQIPLP